MHRLDQGLRKVKFRCNQVLLRQHRILKETSFQFCIEKGKNLILVLLLLSSIQFSHSVVSDSLRPNSLQHARPPCPSPTPGACSNSCPSSQWCHPTSSPSVVPFSSAFNLSQHQGLFQGVSSSHQLAKVLEFQL